MISMERVGIYFRLKPGIGEEYKKRHDEIWPEMTKALNQAGIHNYSIWNHEEMLFAYFEVEDFNNAQSILDNNSVYIQWRKYMEDIIDVDYKTGQKEFFMRLMFYHT
jgi:L-rhamnose mutarotase